MSIALSPDGQSMAFDSWKSGAGPNVWLVNVDGSNARQITHGIWEYEPKFSIDGRWLYYKDPLRANVSKISADGTGDVVEEPNRPVLSSSTVSPDGKLIAEIYKEGVDSHLRLVPSSGGKSIRDFPSITDANFSWTPDGHSIVYVDTPKEWRR
jgi:Tol biopolymer transport system component